MPNPVSSADCTYATAGFTPPLFGAYFQNKSAKLIKNYQKTDEIKNKLKLAGISLQDSPDSLNWEIIF